MKKRLFLFATALCCMFSISGSCEDTVTTYTDDIITFNYDAEFNANIKFIEMDGNTHYSITTNPQDEYANGTVLVAIRETDLYKDDSKTWQDYIAPLESSDISSVTVLNDENNREVFIEPTDTEQFPRYIKILTFNDDKFMFINYTLSADENCNEFLKSIYDSIMLTDSFDINNYFYPEKTEITSVLENLVIEE